MAYSYEEWMGLSDQELIEIYNEQAPRVVIGLDFITSELTRRQDERRMEHLERLNEQTARQVSKLARLTDEGARQTKTMIRLTVLIAVLTVVSAFASVVTLTVTLA